MQLLKPSRACLLLLLSATAAIAAEPAAAPVEGASPKGVGAPPLNFRTIAEPLSVEGLIIPFRQIRLSSPVEAIVRKIEVKEGDRVTTGQILAVLYSPLDLLEAERAEKILAKTEFAWRANDRLSKEKIVSEDKALVAKLEYDVALIESQRARAAIEDKTLRAPWDGQIIRAFKETGETVGRTQEVFQLLDYSQVYVQVYIDARYLPQVREGMTAEVKFATDGSRQSVKAVPATVKFVDPVVDAGSGLFRVKFLIPNADFSIKPGLPATVVFAKIQRE
jgi:RND family efflux transporter MFP subunit